MGVAEVAVMLERTFIHLSRSRERSTLSVG